MKAARKRRGVALDEVHASTKIHRRYLEALERQDWSVFPGTVFARGYLRTYSEYLGLDPQRMLKAYAREHAAAHPDRDCDAEARKAARAMLERLAEARGVRTSAWRRAARAALLVSLVGLAAAAGLWAALRVQDRGPATEPGPVLPREGAAFGRSAEAPPAPMLPQPAATEPHAAPDVALAPVEPAGPPSPARLFVEQHGVGRGVAGHELVGSADRFAEGSVVWFWTRVGGGLRGDRVDHVWIREGRPIGTIPLRVAGAEWRTHSRRLMGVGAAGRWTVEARDVEGRVLASTSFEVVR